MDIQRGHGSTHAERPDARLVDFLHQVLLQLGIQRLFMTDPDRAQQGLLGNPSAVIHRTADPDTHDDRGTGLAACGLDRLQDKLLDALDPITRMIVVNAPMFSLPPPLGMTVMVT
jgi:hypothetical protein